MNNLIRRDEAIESLKYAKTARAEGKYPMPPLTEERVIRFLKALPAVEPKTGKWVRITKGLTFEKYACSICGRQIEDEGSGELLFIKYPYCHCGAKMERSNDELSRV